MHNIRDDVATASTNLAPDSGQTARPAAIHPVALILFPFIAGGLFYGARFLPNLDPNWREQIAEAKAWVGAANDEAQTSGGFSLSGSEESPKREPIAEELIARRAQLAPAAVPIAGLPAPQSVSDEAAFRQINADNSGANAQGFGRNTTANGLANETISGPVSSGRQLAAAAAPAVGFVDTAKTSSSALPPAIRVESPPATGPSLGSLGSFASVIATTRENSNPPARVANKPPMLATSMGGQPNAASSAFTRTGPLGGSSAFTWNGGGNDNNWTTGGNWGGTAPGATANADVTFAGSNRLSPNLNTPYSVNSVSFASGAGAFSLGGGNTLTVGAGGITNGSTHLQAIGVSSLVVGAAQTWNVGTGGLTVSSVLSGGSALTVTGTGGLTLSGNNSAFTGGINVSGQNGGNSTTIDMGSSGDAVMLHLAGAGAAGGSPTFSLIAGNGGSGGAGSNASELNKMFVNGRPGGTGGSTTLTVSSAGAFGIKTAVTLAAGDGGTGGPNGQTLPEFPGSKAGAGGVGGGGGAFSLDVSASDAFAGVASLTLRGGSGGYTSSSLLGGALGGAGGATQLNLTFSTTGNTVSSATDLVLRAGAGHGAGSGVGGGVTISLNGNNLAIGGLDSGGSTANLSKLVVENGSSAASSTLTVGSDDNSHSFVGILENGGKGTLALVKTGAGTLTLTGANTYTGGTNINQGTIVASGTALGTGTVNVASGATLSVGEAVNTGKTGLTTSSLTIGSLIVNGGSALSTTPSLTFNLGKSGTSDQLKLSSLIFSGASTMDLGFASATGGTLGAGTYDLLTFTSPSAGDVTGLDTSTAAAANADFKALGVGNLSGMSPNGSFAWTFDGSGNVSGLTFAFVGTSATMPEPPAAILVLLAGGLVAVIARLQITTMDAVPMEAHDDQPSIALASDLEAQTPR